jgi:hypothetical protein
MHDLIFKICIQISTKKVLKQLHKKLMCPNVILLYWQHRSISTPILHVLVLWYELQNEKDKQSSTNPVELPFHNSATM